MTFKKVLIANRGEIALRVMETCKRLGIATVAVYSDEDRQALHTTSADEAVHVGRAAAAESYLRVEAIMAAAKATGADAIHPGYGFLSERPALVEGCREAGIVFIGPSVHAMNVMGDKVRSRQAMLEAGVPVVPGEEDLADAAAAKKAADAIGYPVMLKASAGGGGKGMRIVEQSSDLERAFLAAQREAKNAFGDDRMFIERAVMRARHVEIQVMADRHGEVVALGERDCSVQRRHQKVIEEAPSPSAQMSEEVRARMQDVAVRAAKAVNYEGAGTVEFLFEETPEGPRFYFLEMNTRLQVEHPVTEMVYGRDLVEDQLRVAAGEPLGYTQADLVRRGHALECRIYAEDPKLFLPSPGVVDLVEWPQGSHIRVDAAVASGHAVSSYYDPMIAKLTVWGADRREAIARMRAALRDTVLLGVESNLAFHRRVLDEKDFAEGVEVTTRYIDNHPELCAPTDPPAAHAEIAAAAAVKMAGSLTGLTTPAVDAPTWRRSAQWRRGRL